MGSRDRAVTSARHKPWPTDAVLDKPRRPLADSALFSHSVVSPLRYPGAKRQLFHVLKAIINSNVPPPRLFVEPFCGGASVGLRFAGIGVVEHLVLADADPLVAAFWYTAAFDTNWLVEAMIEEEVTVARWDWWRLAQPSGRRDRALKCLFLNRTTFSGILHGRAGPIGGRAQASPYKIGCRYGVEGLERRIRAVGDLAATGRLLDVWNCDWRQSLRRASCFGGLTCDEVAVYLDPPYTQKAPELYEWSFDSRQHQELAAALNGTWGFRWVLSYDDTSAVRPLYADCPGMTVCTVDYQYTAAGAGARTSRQELLVTSYPDIPPDLQASGIEASTETPAAAKESTR